MANSTEACEVKICEVGGEGLFLPLFGDAEQVWPAGLRGFLYLLGLLWTFIGVAIVADVFMSAIETITSKKKRVVDPKTGRNYTTKVWNETVSNLTLMALGSSAPEILLSIIELVGDSFFSGALGPSTIVGSAAFNLLVISAVCVAAIPSPEVRFIKEVPVFAVTASFSIIAYLWLLIIVVVISKDVVDVWEGLVTFLMFPLLVGLAFAADKGMFSRAEKVHMTKAMTSKGTRLFEDMTVEELQKAEMKIQKEYGMELSDEDVAKLLAKDIDKHKSKAAYCVGATRGLFGGKRIGDKADRQRPSMKSVVPISEEPVAIAGPPGSVEPEEPGPEPACVVEFVAKNFAVSESIGTVKLRVKRKGDLTSEVKVQYESEDGIAKAGMDYHEVKGELVFLPQEDMKEIEEDEEFYVHLTSIVTVKGQVSGLGRASKARIVIIDDDCPGVLSFEKDVIEVQETSKDQVIQVLVNRKGGSSGSVSCKFQTEAASATQGADYVHTEGTLTFEEGVTSQEIAVTIISKGRVYGKEEFRLILSEAQNGLSFDPERDGGPDQSIATIVILPDEVAKSRLDRVASLLRINRDRAALGASNWKEQLWNAVLVNGGDEEEKPGAYDWVMHVISVFWKVTFALIPPPDYCGGWACFFCSLMMIGLVTALVADLAGLLGCVVGMGDAITAITLVALGTSLPDTFASKAAAQQASNPDPMLGASASGGGVQMQEQLAELDEMEVIAAQRSSEIAQIASSVVELNRIFKDLASLVIDQGTVLDRIDFNTEKIYQRSDEAKGQLHQAVKRKKESDSRAWKCLLVWGTADLILLIVLLIKYQLKYGLKNVAMFLVAIAVMLTVCYFGLKQYKPKVISEGPAYFEKVIPEGWRPEDLWKKLRPGPVNSAKMGMQAMRGSPV